MAIGKLTATEVRALLRHPGKHGDGDGLWLHVAATDRAHWFLHYGGRGKQRQMSLGSARDLSLAQAREAASAARKLILDGVDPIEHRKSNRAVEAAQANVVTFAQAAQAYIGTNEAGWRNATHRRQWRSTLERFAGPVIGALPCNEVTTEHVLRILSPIWAKMPETASRTRGRIETILSYATVRGWRVGPNPAVWRGHLQLMLPAKGKVRRVEHLAALDWREVPAFFAQLRERDSFGARALEFAILTAARSGEARLARWSEIDLDAATWTVPSDRMKAGREHRVPLCARAVELLEEMATLQDGSGLVFLGMRRGVPLSDMTLTAVLRRMGRADITAHGFRSTFRDWAAEATAHPNHVVEMALAHQIGSEVERAYRRGDLFAKRVQLMADWESYLLSPSADVVPLKRERLPRAEMIRAG
jgi:integrase